MNQREVTYALRSSHSNTPLKQKHSAGVSDESDQSKGYDIRWFIWFGLQTSVGGLTNKLDALPIVIRRAWDYQWLSARIFIDFFSLVWRLHHYDEAARLDTSFFISYGLARSTTSRSVWTLHLTLLYWARVRTQGVQTHKPWPGFGHRFSQSPSYLTIPSLPNDYI